MPLLSYAMNSSMTFSNVPLLPNGSEESKERQNAILYTLFGVRIEWSSKAV